MTGTTANLLADLRKGTNAGHRRIEKHPLLRPLMASTLSLDQYARMIAAFTGIHETLEPHMREMSSRIDFPDYRYQPRLSLLIEDCAAFPICAILFLSGKYDKRSRRGPMSKNAKIEGKIDINEFVSQGAGLAKALDAGTALLYNASGKNVTFYCYNGGDVLMTVPYCKPTIASGYSGLVAAGGTSFKVFADNKSDAEFRVKPNKAYVFKGAGMVEQV